MDTIGTDNIVEDDVYRRYAIGRLKGGWEVVLYDEYGKEFMCSNVGGVTVECDKLRNSEPIDFGVAPRGALLSFFGIRMKGEVEVHRYAKLSMHVMCSAGDRVFFEVGDLIISELEA